MTGFELPSVADVAADLTTIFSRLQAGDARPFSFGDGRPEAVLLSYDEFTDGAGESRFERHPGVVAVDLVAANLEDMIAEIRAGSFRPVVCGDDVPRAVIMSTTQYRNLRGDDHPPDGVQDDPTSRSYASEPLPSSRPMSIDEVAEMMGPETTELLRQIREEDEGGRD